VIYFAQLPTGSIKIGCANDVEGRLSGLAYHYGTELALLATMPGDRSVEVEIHERFSHLRLGRTEQFRPGADLMQFIGKPLVVGINPDAIEAHASVRTEHVVRLDLTATDHARLDRQAKKRGLTKASYSRMLILEKLDEEEGAK
jgi:hypothetical protein